MARKIARQIEADSVAILAHLTNHATAAKYNLKPEQLIGIFIPNTYEFYWTATPEEFVDRMYKEYKRFWNKERMGKAQALGFTPTEIATLASIVASETNKSYEYPIIASLYINRVRKGMLLQACPTVIFAVGDFTCVVFKINCIEAVRG